MAAHLRNIVFWNAPFLIGGFGKTGMEMHSDDQLGYPNGDNSTSRHWHLDKRVPIALILTLLVQSAGVAWWMSSTTEKVSVLKERLDAISPQADRLTRVEVNIEDIKMSLTEIKQALKTAPLREH